MYYIKLQVNILSVVSVNQWSLFQECVAPLLLMLLLLPVLIIMSLLWLSKSKTWRWWVRLNCIKKIWWAVFVLSETKFGLSFCAGGEVLGRLWSAELPDALIKGLPRYWMEPSWRRKVSGFPALCCVCEWFVKYVVVSIFKVFSLLWTIHFLFC